MIGCFESFWGVVQKLKSVWVLDTNLEGEMLRGADVVCEVCGNFKLNREQLKLFQSWSQKPAIESTSL